jgi:hypothetical protein
LNRTDDEDDMTKIGRHRSGEFYRSVRSVASPGCRPAPAGGPAIFEDLKSQ